MKPLPRQMDASIECFRGSNRQNIFTYLGGVLVRASSEYYDIVADGCKKRYRPDRVDKNWHIYVLSVKSI